MLPFTCLVLTLSACLLLAVLLALPPVRQRLGYAARTIYTRARYAVDPPDQGIFVPEELVAEAVQATLRAMTRTPTPTLAPPSVAPPSVTPSPAVRVMTPTLPASPLTATPVTPSPTATLALPADIRLTGFRHEYQTFNNCGPATLAMLLSFWGWEGSQATVAAVLRANPDDASVMPQEMVDFVQANTPYRALLRTAGSLDLARKLLAAGFPVMIEVGIHPEHDWWVGHYLLLTGYSDAEGRLRVEDSLTMPDTSVAYADLQARGWRDFNDLLLVVYPPEREAEVLELLGEEVDPALNAIHALEKAQQDLALKGADSLAGRDLFFALFNQADSLLALGRNEEAASAFDLAYAVYPSLEPDERPWRLLWYRTGPYEAYYRAGRYNDLLKLTTVTIDRIARDGLEESHYYRGLAFLALGNRDYAAADLRIAIELRPGYTQAVEALNQMGEP